MNKKGKIKLLLLPYAGASSLMYSEWDKYLDEHIIMSPVELPGRGLRFKEPLCKSMDELIDRILDYVKNEIKDCDYAFFGYCASTVIVYELYKRIVENNLRKPSNFIICAHPAPNIEMPDKPIEGRTEEEVIDEWFELEERPFSRKEFYEKEYIRKSFEVWKTDCEIMDNYCFSEPVCKFNCDLTLVSGKQDDFLAPPESLDTWKAFTAGETHKYILDGGHFFLKTNKEDLMKVINEVI